MDMGRERETGGWRDDDWERDRHIGQKSTKRDKKNRTKQNRREQSRIKINKA
jgi:hypothetical protein